MKWKDTDKKIVFFNEYTFNYNRSYNRYDNPFREKVYYYSSNLHTNGFAYPKKDLKNVSTFETKTLKPESKLCFDSGSGFPRFKLALSDSKRCIKVDKADCIVVSGSNDVKISEVNWNVIEDNNTVYVVNEECWNNYFRGIVAFKNMLSPYVTFDGEPTIIYSGIVASYSKESVYLAKYADGVYTKPFITDKELDKIICKMCPEPTYEEFESILEMLNSEDASIVQLGVKMIAGYNVDKYKLSMRLVLCTRLNWYLYTKNTVGTQQLMQTLGITQYQIKDDFSDGARQVQRRDETYIAEDIAIAKKLSSKMVKEWLQNTYQRYLLQYEYEWLPDERKIELK